MSFTHSGTMHDFKQSTCSKLSGSLSDSNLLFSVKYLGLLAMSRILKTHPKSVQSHKDLIMCCLDDKDDSIRLRALDLLYGMVSHRLRSFFFGNLLFIPTKETRTLGRPLHRRCPNSPAGSQLKTGDVKPN